MRKLQTEEARQRIAEVERARWEAEPLPPPRYKTYEQLLAAYLESGGQGGQDGTSSFRLFREKVRNELGEDALPPEYRHEPSLSLYDVLAQVLSW